jgi:hypothetical protein
MTEEPAAVGSADGASAGAWAPAAASWCLLAASAAWLAATGRPVAGTLVLPVPFLLAVAVPPASHRLRGRAFLACLALAAAPCAGLLASAPAAAGKILLLLWLFAFAVAATARLLARALGPAGARLAAFLWICWLVLPLALDPLWDTLADSPRAKSALIRTVVGANPILASGALLDLDLLRGSVAYVRGALGPWHFYTYGPWTTTAGAFAALAGAGLLAERAARPRR